MDFCECFLLLCQYLVHLGFSYANRQKHPPSETCMPRQLREQYPEVVPGFYCDKRTWVAALLDGELPDEVLMSLCDLSYRLVVEKLPKYVRRELAEE